MPSKDPKTCCHKDALKAIQDAHTCTGRNFRHSCNVGDRHKSKPTPGAQINQYNNYLLDGITATTLLDETETYNICKNMKKKNKKGKNNQLEDPSEAEEEVAETKETIIEF